MNINNYSTNYFNNVVIFISIIFFSYFIIYNRYDINELIFFSHHNWFTSYGASLNQHLSGFYGLFYDDWRLPLTATDRLNYPNYSTAILTDSLPIFAVLFKLFKNYLPSNFHYFGYWKILCILLLCFSSFYLFYNQNNKKIFISILFMIFSISSYPYFSREGNPTLNGHFLVYISLIFYLNIKNKVFNYKSFFCFVGILVFSLLIHFYYFVFCLLLFLSSYLQNFLNKNIDKNKLIKIFIIALTIIILVGYLFGYFFNMNGIHFDRFSEKGMPIISLFFASEELGIKTIFGNNMKLLFLDSQYESLNYLGIGYIILIILSFYLIYKINYLKDILYSNLFLIFSLLGVFIYSLGSNIYLTNNINFEYNHHATHIPFFTDLTGILGVPGRMFIYNYIIISYFLFKLVVNSLQSIISIKFVLFLITFLQFYEIYLLNYSNNHLSLSIPNFDRENIKKISNLKNSDYYNQNEQILNSIERDVVFIFPPHQCSGSKLSHFLYSELIRKSKKVNSIWGGRDNYNCDKKKQDFSLATNSLDKYSYIFIEKFSNVYKEYFDLKKFLRCKKFNKATVCH